MSSLWLNARRDNITSQNGEDGVLQAIFERIGEGKKWCCEFGAWDGMTFSNTYSLLMRGWSGVLIESVPERFEKLVRNTAQLNVTAIRAMVTNVDGILRDTEIPKDFDLLSIDVDGQDYPLWQDMRIYRPRVVVLEVNSGFQPDVSHWSKERGTSLKMVTLLAKARGYELALHTGNAIFVRREYCETLEIEPNNWQELFDWSWIRDEGKHRHTFV